MSAKTSFPLPQNFQFLSLSKLKSDLEVLDINVDLQFSEGTLALSSTSLDVKMQEYAYKLWLYQSVAKPLHLKILKSKKDRTEVVDLRDLDYLTKKISRMEEELSALEAIYLSSKKGDSAIGADIKLDK